MPEDVLREEASAWRASRTSCPDPDLLLVRESELLEPAVRAALEAHVKTCDACARLAADLESLALGAPTSTTADAVLARVRQRGSSMPFWRLPLAAALIIGCATAIAWWTRSAYAPHSASASAANTATADKTADKPGASVASVTPLVALWTVEALPVRVPLSSVGVSRSGDATGDASTALMHALVPYQAGRYAEAIAALHKVVAEHPQSGDAWLYLGVALLLADRPQEALAPLERAAALVDASRRMEVDWYRATAEQRAGQATAARERLHALCGQPGVYQQRACAGEQALR
jgi:tetratricopeptide (TPR) repeat protein